MILKSNLLSQLHRCLWRRATCFIRGHHEGRSHAVVVGCYKENESEFNLTTSGHALQNIVSRNILELLTFSNFKADVGTNRSLYNLHPQYPCITIAGLGDKEPEYNKNEGIDEGKENVRIGIGSAVRCLRSEKFETVVVDPCGFSSASAEGAYLGSYVFDKYKSEKKGTMEINLLDIEKESCDEDGWQKGLIAAESQNFARELMETPSNFKYPSLFADIISQKFSVYDNVTTMVRDEKWAEEKKMGCFLSVGQGSVNRSCIVELHYKGADTKPLVLIGKGVTFDTGGISIKGSNGMSSMRGDMGGAACMLATFEAAVRMNLPVNLIVLVGLTENMPSGSATKPGDVFTAMNGKTVAVEDTDYEGRLVLADLLCYGNEWSPDVVINAATLTGEVDVALGTGATGAYSTCDTLWSHLHEAGVSSGDRMWRMPLFNCYTKAMKDSITADLQNKAKNATSAGSCTAAAFLKEFVSTKHWAHLDIAGVAGLLHDGGIPYLEAGMSGRPTRTLIETVQRLCGKKL